MKPYTGDSNYAIPINTATTQVGRITSRRYWWDGLVTSADTIEAIQCGGDIVDTVFQIIGTSYGTSGDVTTQGSNDNGTTWTALKDETGTAITHTSGASFMHSISTLPDLIRPYLTAGTGANIDVIATVGFK
jgi:hypothetical protein